MIRLLLIALIVNMEVMAMGITKKNIELRDGAAVKLQAGTSNNYVSIKAPSTADGNVTFTLPGSNGSDGQLLRVDGNGNASWVSIDVVKPSDIGEGVLSGGTISTSDDLNGTLTATHAFVGGKSVDVAETTREYTANKATYIDVDSTGTLHYIEVDNNDSAPAVTANSIRIAKVVTDDDSIISTTDMRNNIKVGNKSITSVDNTIPRFDGTNGDLQGSDITILDNGNVGIGSINPTQKLTIKTNGLDATNKAAANQYGLTLFNSNSSNGAEQGLSFVTYNDDTTEFEGSRTPGGAIIFERTSSWSRGKLHFKVKTTTGETAALTTALTINDNGNVGIGTTGPDHKLQVNGDSFLIYNRPHFLRTATEYVAGFRYDTKGGETFIMAAKNINTKIVFAVGHDISVNPGSNGEIPDNPQLTITNDEVLIKGKPIENAENMAWHEVGADGEPAFENNWENFSNTYGKASFKKVNGIVYIRGLVKSGDNRSTIFTLPEGYRPAVRIMLSAPMHGKNAVRLDIDKDGHIKYPDDDTDDWQSITVSFAL